MNILNYVKDALATISYLQEIEGGVLRISTQCMYPSNTLVSVYIQGGENTFVVTDDGGAIKELTSSGVDVQHSTRSIDNFVTIKGANYSDGIISSPHSTLKELPTAIILVANASKELAAHLLANTKIKKSVILKN